MTIYFVAGGLLSSAWVNVVQLVVLMVGFPARHPAGLRGGRRHRRHHRGAGLPTGFLESVPHAPDRFGVGLEAARGLRTGVHDFPRTGAEGVRRARRARRADRHRRAGRLPPVLLVHPGLLRHGRAGAASRHREPEPRAADVPGAAICRRGSARWVWRRCSPPKSAPATPSCSCCRRRCRRISTSGSSSRPPPTAGAAGRAARGGRRRRDRAWCSRSGSRTWSRALTIFYSLVGVSLFVPVVAGLAGRRGGAPEALASIARRDRDPARRPPGDRRARLRHLQSEPDRPDRRGVGFCCRLAGARAPAGVESV